MVQPDPNADSGANVTAIVLVVVVLLVLVVILLWISGAFTPAPPSPQSLISLLV